MNIKDIPEEYETLESFNRAYEDEHFRFTVANQRVGTATREMFVRWFPRLAAPVVRSAIHALLDDRLLDAFGFPRANPVMRWLVPASLRWRARLARWLPARCRPQLRTEMRRSLYPEGYEIESLGPGETSMESNQVAMGVNLGKHF